MIPNNEKIKFAAVLQEAIEWSRLSVSQFCIQSGFQPDRVYRVQNDDTIKLSLDSLEQILNRFPELNGDRFIRRTGPLLLSGLCEPEKDYEADIQASNENNKYQQSMMEMKDKQIAFLESQIEFLKDMLSKRP